MGGKGVAFMIDIKNVCVGSNVRFELLMWFIIVLVPLSKHKWVKVNGMILFVALMKPKQPMHLFIIMWRIV